MALAIDQTPQASITNASRYVNQAEARNPPRVSILINIFGPGVNSEFQRAANMPTSAKNRTP